MIIPDILSTRMTWASGSGVYRLQIRLNRPEGCPLYSLKWEGPL